MSEQETREQLAPPQPQPAGQRLRRRALYFGVSLMVLAGAYVGWWQVVASRFQHGLDQWIDQQGQRGWRVQFDKRVQSGFPGAIHIRLDAPSLTATEDGQQVWSGDYLSLSVKPWAIDRIAFEAGGNHRLQWPDAAAVYRVRIEKAGGRVHLAAGQARSLDVDLTGLVVENPASGQVWQVAESHVSARNIDAQTLGFRVRVRHLQVPPALKAPLGAQIGHFDAKGSLNGSLALGPLPEALELWRDAGGTLDITAFDLDYPPLRMRGAGTAALDSRLQPEAAFTVQAEGFPAALDALQKQGMIAPATAFTAKVALAVLSKKPETGGSSYVELPLTVQDQTLYAGSLGLLKLRPLVW